MNDCRLDHLALIDVRDGGLPAYDAAHAFAVRSTAVRCPDDLRREADAYAWLELKRQHVLPLATRSRPLWPCSPQSRLARASQDAGFAHVATPCCRLITCQA